MMIVCLSCNYAFASTKIIFQDDKMTVTETLHSFIPFSAHAAVSDTISITVFGKTYKNVRGYIPFYLTIPQKDSILFVTGAGVGVEGKAIVHVVNLTTRQEIHFPAYDSRIGSDIRTDTGLTTQEELEKIERADGDKIIINARFFDGRYRYYLNLAKPEFEKEEGSDIFEGHTNTWVYPNGEKPKN